MATSLLLAHEFPPARGGVARVMGEIARRHPAGTLVVSTGSERAGPASAEGIAAQVDRLPLSPRQLRTLPGLLLWSRRATSLARLAKAAFVWSGHLKPTGYVARWVRERLGTPYGLLVYGADVLALRHQMQRLPGQRRAVQGLFQSAAVVVAVSEWTRDQCLGLMGELEVNASQLQVQVVPLGADPAVFHPGSGDEALRRRLGMNDGTWLLTVGGSAPHKGVDTVLRALASLKQRYPLLRYAVAGAGAHTEALRRLADAHGVGDRVIFAPDIPDAELPGLYTSADIYLGVSRREGRSVEGFGIAIAEAAASGLPVIAGRSGGIPEMVRDGETGLLVDPERVGPLVEAIAALVDDPARAKSLGAAGRAGVEQYFNWDRAVGELRGIAERKGDG